MGVGEGCREGEKQQSKVNVVGGWFERIAVTVRLRLSCYQVINLFRSSLSRPCQFIGFIYRLFTTTSFVVVLDFYRCLMFMPIYLVL